MAAGTRLVDRGQIRVLGSGEAAIGIGEGERAKGSWMGNRYLTVNGRSAFELSYWCGTCGFLFERLAGANTTLSVAALQDRLDAGLTSVADDVVDTASELLPEGRYLPLLLELAPTLVYPMGAGDYFSEEKVLTWGVDPFWGLPTYPRTPYYRGDTRELGITEMNASIWLYEFVVPLVPPSWNDAERVAQHAKALRASASPTALAISILDVNRPAVDQPGAVEPDRSHWGLTHFLLDGHHKMQAAAETGTRLHVLSLLALDAGLADEAQLTRFEGLLATT